MPLSSGQVLNNRYRIVRLLGQGGFGAVYRAWDLTLSHPCALKESFEQGTEAGRQFLREAQILANLSHPNLPRVTDFFSTPGTGQYLVMDYIEGQDLEELRMQAGGKLAESQLLPWISQVCDALGYLHRQQPPVIHRDIKPANIKIAPPDQYYPGGRVMLVDFGVAKVYDPALRTTMGARAVTPGYSPHEQYGQTGSATDARTDIYALGATLYTLLTGQEPVESVLRMATDPLVPPRQLNPGISPAVESATLTAMQMEPGHRFQSAAEFKAGLPAAASRSTEMSAPVIARPAGPPPQPVPATPGAPLPRAARPIPWKWIGLGGGLVAGCLLLAAIAGMLMLGSQNSRLTQTAQARIDQTAAALAAVPTATQTFTPSPTLPPTATPTPSPIPPSPTSTALGGGSGRIAFASSESDTRDIYVMNIDGSGRVNLTNNAAFDDHPSWSPDGKQIAFYSDRDGNHEIYVMNADGSNLTRLTNNAAEDSHPSWSPDGSQIGFLSNRDGDDEVFVMNADGSGQIPLTDNDSDDFLPAWSPDGLRIAFISYRDENYEIYVMNADGSGQTRLTNNDVYDGFPTWSPDGRQILFFSDRDGNSEIYVMNPDGSGVSRLTNNDAYDGVPCWSPDGRWIAFVSYRDDNYELYMMNADGSRQTRLTDSAIEAWWPSWEP